MPWFGIVSYAVAAIAFALMATVLLASHPVSRRAFLLVTATIGSCVWAVGFTALLATSESAPFYAFVGFDSVHMVLWIACVQSWRTVPSGNWLLALASVCGLWVLAAAAFPASLAFQPTAHGALALLALLGLVAVMQVLRSASADQLGQVRLLCVAVGAIFAIEVLTYLPMALRGEVTPVLWEARGFANAALGALAILAVKRHSEWEFELFVSRRVVFYTASLLAFAAYVAVIASLAYAIQAIGGWTPLRQTLFLLVAVGLLFLVLYSTQVRSQLRVLLLKHFYRDRYDYREEWLRLTQSIGNTPELEVLIANALAGLARIVGSQDGDLWLWRDSERYQWMASIDRKQTSEAVFDKNHAIVKFLASHGWVIDSGEYSREPERYGYSFGDPADGVLPRDCLIVPLDCLGQLQGFVVLQRPPGLRPLNFEDHDILKTAGKQIAVVLAQALAQERLAETRQFEVMNKLSTFLMHDLKNIVAQQELVIANAQRFRHRPEFIDDAFATIRGGVERMKRVLEHLRSATQAETNPGRVDVSKILMEVRSQCEDREPVPQIELAQKPAFVAMDRDKLTSVITHLIRNSQDATPADGSIQVRLENGGDHLFVTVTDTGCGMDAAFIRDRLFRPFDSTKGARGMGIGVYQVRHLIRSAGGDVEVRSQPGVGTSFRLRLPALSR